MLAYQTTVADRVGKAEPLFVAEGLETGARFNVSVSAVNQAGNEGPRSRVVVGEVQARAAVA